MSFLAFPHFPTGNLGVTFYTLILSQADKTTENYWGADAGQVKR